MAKKYTYNPRTGRFDIVGTNDTMVSPGIKGLYNSVNGLAKWRNSRGRAGQTSAGTGLGGVDICVIGTSVTVGAYASSYLYDTWPSLLRRKIQDNHNPDGVQGGMGFTPLQTGDNTWTKSDTPGAQTNKTVWTFDTEANWTFESGSSGLYGAGMRRTRTTSNGTGSRARFVWDGGAADAVNKRLQVTDIELLHHFFSSDGTITWDRLTSDAFVAVGAGASTGTINCNAATNTGVHSGRQASGLTKGDVNGIQVSQASGSAIVRVDGAIAYCDDWDRGFRIHNLAMGGSRADYMGQTTSAAVMLANTTKWGSTAPGGAAAGATQAGLFLLDFILNDVGSNASPTITLANFETYWRAILDSIEGCASLPSALIWIPPCRNDADTEANYQAYVDLLYSLADEYDVALFDSWYMLGKGQHSATCTPNGWGFGDGTHWSDLGNQYWADVFYRILFSI